MNDMSLSSKIYIKINYTHNSLGESVTIRSYKQFSPVKLEVGLWSWVTFCHFAFHVKISHEGLSR